MALELQDETEAIVLVPNCAAGGYASPRQPPHPRTQGGSHVAEKIAMTFRRLVDVVRVSRVKRILSVIRSILTKKTFKPWGILTCAVKYLELKD